MLSQKALKTLKCFKLNHQYSEEDLPCEKGASLIPFLVSGGYLAENRLPPEDDPDFPYGVRVYSITSLGMETLCQAGEDTRKMVLGSIWKVFKYLLVWGIGVATPAITSFLKSLPFIQSWLNNIG